MSAQGEPGPARAVSTSSTILGLCVRKISPNVNMAQAREPHRESGGEARPSTDRAERSGGHGRGQGPPDATPPRPPAGGLVLGPRSPPARPPPRARPPPLPQ